MKTGTLYFHSNCFDGLVSGTLAWVLLESEGWDLQEFIPVNYEIRATWLSASLKKPAAVVDFLYHPDAAFWADHHPTTFLDESAQKDFAKRRDETWLFFDPEVGSCARLLWDSLKTHVPESERYREAVYWAEKIDTASYTSVEEAVWGDSPALQIKHSLTLANDPGFYRLLLTEMRSGDLARIANLTPISERYQEVRRRIAAGLERAKTHVRLDGDVVVMDLEMTESSVVSRYAPYHFFPAARYSIGVLRSEASTIITAMRNPFMNFQSVPLGKIMKTFGGGGHERVGSVLIGQEDSNRVDGIIKELVRNMQVHAPVESVSR